MRIDFDFDVRLICRRWCVFFDVSILMCAFDLSILLRAFGLSSSLSLSLSLSWFACLCLCHVVFAWCGFDGGSSAGAIWVECWCDLGCVLVRSGFWISNSFHCLIAFDF